MKKRFMFILMVICLVTMLVGCGDKSSSIRKLIKHETSKDKIKFNDIEWLITVDEAEKKINKLIDSVDDKAKTDYELTYDDLPNGIKEHRYAIQYENRSKSIGKLAGWDIVTLMYDTINIENIDNNEYVFMYWIDLASNEESTNKIFNDLSSKLQSKYGKPYDSGVSYSLPYEKYKDNNGNEILLTVPSPNGNYVELRYWCADVDNYIMSLESNGL